MHGLEATYGDRIGFVYLDIDNPATAGLKQELGYRYQPHFFLVDGEGTVLRTWLGPIQEADVAQAFEESLR